MSENEARIWCQNHDWTELRRLELGIWVGFPPGGVMETPLPLQMQRLPNKPIEYIFDFTFMALVTATVFGISLIISLCFIEPIIDRCRNSY